LKVLLSLQNVNKFFIVANLAQNVNKAQIPHVINTSRTGPFLFIHSNSHYLYFWTAIYEFYSMDNAEPFVAAFNQTLEKEKL